MDEGAAFSACGCLLPLKSFVSMWLCVIVLVQLTGAGALFGNTTTGWFLPILAGDRQSFREVKLTPIGRFGLRRKARPEIPAHLHTGIDLKRPSNNYLDEPIFPAFEGRVISLRDDGAFAQIIIEHSAPGGKRFWTVYEHIAGILIQLDEIVDPSQPIARFMTRRELERYGRQFDHLHFEILKIPPKPRAPDKKRPYRHFNTYCLECYTYDDLERRYYSPIKFLNGIWSGQTSEQAPQVKIQAK